MQIDKLNLSTNLWGLRIKTEHRKIIKIWQKCDKRHKGVYNINASKKQGL